MCNCIKETRDFLHEQIKPYHCLYFTHVCTNMKTGIEKFQIPFDYDYESKNGKIKTKHTFIAAVYCPVCGKKYEE